MIVALCAAVAGAVAYGVGSVSQAFAARNATRTRVLRQPAYLLGTGCDLLGFAASLVAVRDLPLFAVQSVLAGSLAVTAVLARFVLGTRIGPRNSAAIGAVVASLAVISLAASPQSARVPPAGFATALILGMTAAAVLVIIYYRSANATRLELLAGASFAGSAIGARAIDFNGAWYAVPGQPVAWTIVGFGVIGSLAYARSLEHGSAGTVTATVWVVEVLLAGLVGILVLGDAVLPGWGLPALGAAGTAALGCAVLAQTQPTAPRQPRTCGHVVPRTGAGVRPPIRLRATITTLQRTGYHVDAEQ